MNLRLLLVEPEPQEALYLRDVLVDTQGGRHFHSWVHIDTIQVETWADAEAILGSERIDLVLLNPELPDSAGFETFRRCRAVAPKTPVMLLLGVGEEALGVRMVREGAQDFLIRGEVDCQPLAHALSNAMERERIASAAQALRFIDPLTGLANLASFTVFAERDRKLAELLGTRWMILLAEVQTMDRVAEVHGEQRRDWALVQMAELMRHLAESAQFLYRVSATRFALTLFETDFESLEHALKRVERGLAGERVLLGSAIYSPQEPESLEDLFREASDFATMAQNSHRAVGAA
jgi:two-component system, cell cycle response regulator